MNFDRNTLIGVGVAAIMLLGGLAYWLWGKSSTDDQVASGGECKAIETFEVTDKDYTLGKADAPLTMIEYASMTCPHCARFENDVFPILKANYIDKGYVRYVFREFPLDRVALTASVVGRCLARDAYIPYVELMYSEIQTWATAQDQRAAIKEMARRAGMTGDEFEKCLASEDDAKRVMEIQKKAIKDYCIGGTPAFLLEGKSLASGEISWEELDKKLRDAAKAKGVTIPEAATPAADTTTPAQGATTAPADGTAAPAAGGAGSTPADGSAKPSEKTPAAATAPAEPAKAPPAH